ncbi:alpha/beta hydrolase [Paraconexibacter antarcticus]|uniref:prolyl aminopeptidase n=1 Tax=Paraconexibacter antarcticus TaxID=2949664 RepID=A0ABY5DYJ0_9ACTN|nr:alpha/beta hydrolase [Paraconexibacter antarcticus]UTI66595.1 alpha/beta hydrolase [Paraconexibacter antarcticus]
MRLPHRLAAVLAGATLALAAAGAGPARAALPWVPCNPTGLQCTSLAVPLDRAGTTPGTIMLSARRAPAPSGAATTAVVALAGGPGQAAQPIATGFRKVLAPLLGSRDLLVFDQRGTGQSNPLTCAAFRVSQPSLVTATRQCSAQLGAARAFFTTAQSVEDIEALRIAGGYSKLIIYGVSYGTKVALAYAAAHPAATEGLILDSVVTPGGPDALRRSTLAAVPRVLGRDLCGAGACTGITRDVVADVKKVAARIAVHPYRGPVISGSGRRYTARLSAEGLLGILIAGDLDPTLRAELPGSLRAALTGDTRPLLRLSARSAGLENAAHFQQAEADSEALFFDTVCEENTTLPWTRGASIDQRAREAEAAVKGAPAALFGVFPRSVALGGIPTLCLGWSVASPPPAAPGPLPDVPTLLLDGQSDLRTPIEDAQAVAARFPRAQLITVPHSGHSVLGTEPAGCGAAAVAAFAAGIPAAACPAVPNPYGPTPRPPASLATVKIARGFSPKIGRTLNAVVATLTDARRQVIGAALGSGRVPSAVGGLRSGSVRVKGSVLTLRRYEYVPGVKLSGTYRLGGTARVSVTGSAAAHGTLTLTKAGRATGRLGGRRILAGAARSLRLVPARDANEPTLAQAVARGRLARAGA